MPSNVNPISQGYLTDDNRINERFSGMVTLNGGNLWTGNGVPPVALGTNGDVYIRFDGAAGAFIYQKRAGAWIASAA